MAKKPFYSQEPAVPAKKIAGTNPVGSVTAIGNFKPTSVPLHPGRTKALGPLLRQPHGYGHKPKHKVAKSPQRPVPWAPAPKGGLKSPKLPK